MLLSSHQQHGDKIISAFYFSQLILTLLVSKVLIFFQLILIALSNEGKEGFLLVPRHQSFKVTRDDRSSKTGKFLKDADGDW